MKAFTLNDYRELINLASKNYRFCIFGEADLSTGICLWRHDVDFSIENSVIISNLEKELGIRSTFFIQLSSVYYNVFDSEILNKIKEIKSNGHEIGLHFYTALYDIQNESDLVDKINFEKTTFEKLVGLNIKVFSFHNPTKKILKYDKYEYAGMINTYSKFFREKFSYCSDSNGYWRFMPLDKFLSAGYDRIQVLTHPIWWQDDNLLPRLKIIRYIKKRGELLIESYDNKLKSYGRINIGKNAK